MDYSKLSENALDDILATGGDVSKMQDSTLDEITAQATAPAAPAETPEVEAPASQSGTITQSVPITDMELETVAKKHGADYDKLRNHMIARGAVLSSTTGLGQEALGVVGSVVGEGVLMGIPQKIAAMTEDENTQKAIDEATNLMREKRSYLEAGGEFAAGILTPGTGLAKAAVKAPLLKAAALGAAEGAVLGAAGGFGQSEAGEEVSGAATGAALGGTLGGVLGIVSSRLGRLHRGVSQEDMQKTLASAGVDVPAMIVEEVENPVNEGLITLARNLKDIPEGEQETLALRRIIMDRIEQNPELMDNFTSLYETALEKNGGNKGQAFEEVLEQLDDEMREFASYLKFGKAKAPGQGRLKESDAINELRGLDAEKTADEFIAFKSEQAVLGKLKAKTRAIVEETGGFKKFAPIVTSLRSSRSVAAKIDRRIPGMGVTRAIDDFSEANKRSTVNLSHMQEEADVLTKEYLEAVPGRQQFSPDVRRVYMALDGHEKSQQQLSSAEKKVFDSYRDLFESWRVRMNQEAGYEKFKKAENYVPHRAMSHVEGAAKIDYYLKNLKEAGLDLLGNETTEEDVVRWVDSHGREGLDDVNSVLRSISFYAGEEQTNKIGKELNLDRARDAWRAVTNPAFGGEIEGITAKAEMARRGDIPMLIRETRLPVLAQAWASDASRAVYLDPVIKRLRYSRNIIANIGDKESTEYLTNLIQDLSGRQRDSVANRVQNAFQQSQFWFLKKANDNPDKRAYYEAMAEWPRVFNGMVQQLYPSFLGLHNATASVVNLLSTLSTTLPELGYVYGPMKMGKAVYDIVNMVRREGVGLETILRRKGFKGAEWSTELSGALQDPLLRNPALRGSRSALRWINSALMYAFSASENINIAIAMRVGEDVADDLFHGRNTVMVKEFMERLQEGQRAELNRHLRVGDLGGARDLLSKHMVAKTVLNYDRANMAEAARSFGPLLSMFSRWPSAMLGEVLEQWEMKGAAKGSMEIARKLLAPVFLYAAIDAAIGEEHKDELWYTMLAGKGKEGLTRHAPISALGSFTSGKYATPPLLQPLGAVKPALAGDFESAGSFLIKSAEGFIPMARPIHAAIEAATE